MAAKLIVVKRFTYRANANEEYSNTYNLTGATPADPTAWRTLFNALVTAEKTVYPSLVSVIKGYGYDSFDEDATSVWSVDLRNSPDTPVPGTLAVSTNPQSPGDAAVWVRWTLNRLNSKGKKIYLRKYFHPAYNEGGTSRDSVLPAQTTALNAFGAKLDDGSFLDARKITDALGTTTTAHSASVWVTTRTLKRRGKRPPT